MTTTITWTFPQLDTNPDIGGGTTEVVSVMWTCTATDTDTGITASTSGLVGLTSPVDYSTMTFNSTETLVFSLISQSEVETETSNVLASKLSEAIVPMAPPF